MYLCNLTYTNYEPPEDDTILLLLLLLVVVVVVVVVVTAIKLAFSGSTDKTSKKTYT
jgi:flagellar basal body-associated protein FliL